MNETIEAILSDAEGRYLEATEQSVLTDFATSLEARLRAMRSLQQHEATIVKATMDALWEEHPEMKTNHVDAYKKGMRDMTLVLRYSALAMVRDSTAFLDQKLLYWFKTILGAFDMTTPMVFAYQRLDEEAKQALEAQDYELIAPFLHRTREVLAPGEESAAAE